MRCPTQDGNPEVLLNYAASRLKPQAAALFEQHALECAECARLLQAQQHVWSALDEWHAAPVSESFDERLYMRIEADSRRSVWDRLFDGVAWKPALAGAMATVALAAMFLGPHETPATGGAADMTTRSESLEAEQIERALEDMEMLRQLGSASAANAASSTL